jgi:hypothetical protein
MQQLSSQKIKEFLCQATTLLFELLIPKDIQEE